MCYIEAGWGSLFLWPPSNTPQSVHRYPNNAPYNKSTLFQIQNEVKYTPLPEIKSGFVYPVPKSEREKAFQVKPQIPIQPTHIFENNHPTPKAFAHWSYYMEKKTFAHQKSLFVPDDQVGLFSNLAMVL